MGAGTALPETEGYIPFDGYRTYYRIAGTCAPGKLPLLVLHGGPGAAHYYLQSLDGIARRYGRAVIYYDQSGCGKSRTPVQAEKWSCAYFLSTSLPACGARSGSNAATSWGRAGAVCSR